MEVLQWQRQMRGAAKARRRCYNELTMVLPSASNDATMGVSEMVLPVWQAVSPVTLDSGDGCGCCNK
jgi:hypothetical protein